MSIGDYAIGVDKKSTAARKRIAMTIKSSNRDRGRLYASHEIRQRVLRIYRKPQRSRKTGRCAKKGGKNGAKNDGRNEVRQYE